MAKDLPCRRQQLLLRPLTDEYDDNNVIEILSRLPVKSLIRFRCVCKSGLALISDYYFVMKHCNHAVMESNFACNRFRFLSSIRPPESIDYKELLLFDTKDYDDGSCVASTELRLPKRLDGTTVVGSCNGLICLHQQTYDCLFLCNPSTGDVNRLPLLPTSFPSSGQLFEGFGYDSTAHDYKVVMGIDCKTATGALTTTTVAVFSLKTGSWKTTENLKYVDLDEIGCFLNGAIHWRQPKLARIIAFDLVQEKFQGNTVPLPELANENTSVTIGTVIRNNSLFVSYNTNPVHPAITIWVMKEYGFAESWTKFIIHTSGWSLRGIALIYIEPVCILENGQVLLSFYLIGGNYGLLLYNPQEKTHKIVHESHKFEVETLVMYVETLVSPKNGVGI
ncbi:F-box/kelch-repeat protein At3g06240-like [Pyrus communis]|uniref:F-box/kelch-repeat protein At3g06240-like n=1 Tax=Pyrus communis TaxID=23211 RepID=UPI0035C16F01